MLLTACLILSGSAAPAQEPPREEKKVCKKVEEPGARFSARRVCMTKAEWEQAAKSERSAPQEQIRQTAPSKPY